MKLILTIIDGLGDRPCINNKTPLEAAKTPNLDFLAKNGETGLVYPVKGIAPESDSAICSILSYNVMNNYPGRGVFEAYGQGIKIKDGDLALRINFATVKNGKLIERRAGRTLTTKEGEKLAEEINKKLKFDDKNVSFKLLHSIEHRGILIIKYKGKKLSKWISNTDPGYQSYNGIAVAVKNIPEYIQKCKPLKKGAQLSADLVNEFIKKSYKILKNHPINIRRKKKGLLPANVIITRDSGNKFPNFKSIKDKFGLKMAVIAGMPLEQGIGKTAGMKVISFNYPEMKNTNVYEHLYNSLRKEIRVAKRELVKNYKNFDGFYIHFKPTDIPGHDGRPRDKKKMIEILDSEFYSWLRNRFQNDLIVVTADHSTPCKLKAHSADPVPLLIYSPKTEKDKVEKYSENACKKGSITLEGKQLMSFIRKSLK